MGTCVHFHTIHNNNDKYTKCIHFHIRLNLHYVVIYLNIKKIALLILPKMEREGRFSTLANP